MDRHVPVKSKALALAIGCGLTTALVALEVPLESVLGILLPFIGEALDLFVDGLEVLVLPMVLASAVLPYLLPRQLARVSSRR